MLSVWNILQTLSHIRFVCVCVYVIDFTLSKWHRLMIIKSIGCVFLCALKAFHEFFSILMPLFSIVTFNSSQKKLFNLKSMQTVKKNRQKSANAWEIDKTCKPLSNQCIDFNSNENEVIDKKKVHRQRIFSGFLVWFSVSDRLCAHRFVPFFFLSFRCKILEHTSNAAVVLH